MLSCGHFLQKLQEPRVDNVLFIQSKNKQYRNIYLDLRQIGCYCVRHTILQPILSSVSMNLLNIFRMKRTGHYQLPLTFNAYGH